MKQKSILILLGASLATLAFAQPSLSSYAALGNEPLVGTETGTRDESKQLKAALAAITENNLSADLHFIASDEMGGRDTPSEGLRMSARFIRARLMRLGFTPAGDEGSFLHRYELSRSGVDVAKCKIDLKREGEASEWRFGNQYYFSRGDGLNNSKLTGGLVFGGSGRNAELEGLELEGKWLLILEDKDMSASVARDNAEAAGALGLMVATHPNDQDRHSKQRAGQFARFMGRSSLRVASSAEAPVFPRMFISADALEELTFGDVPEVGTDLELTLSDERHMSGDSEPFEVENVAGLWPGSDPKLAKEVMIISAHYDHVGQDEEGVFNGADDNGSGTCGLMAIAEALKAHGPMKRSVLLMWVSGEEKGLLGSEAWTKNPTLPASLTAVCNLNIDMIGRNAPDYLLITPTAEHQAYNGLTRMAEKYGPIEGFPKLGSADEYWARSDHANFSQHMGIPVAFLFSDVHDDYHQRSDTIEKIDFNKIKRISSMVVRMLDELQDMDLSEL